MMHFKNKTQFSNICFVVLCFLDALFGNGQSPVKSSFSQSSLLGGLYVIRVHLLSGNTVNFVTCIVGNMQLHYFSFFLFMLAHSQTRFRKIRIIWNCTFFVVLVFAKFPIKSIQHASKSFPHPLLFKSSFLKYFCTYVTSFSVCASVLGIFSMDVLRTLHNFYSTGRCQKSYNGDNYKISERTRFQY